jgi:hypothetical protein
MIYTKGDEINLIIERRKMKFYDEWFEYLVDREYYDENIIIDKDKQRNDLEEEEEYNG